MEWWWWFIFFLILIPLFRERRQNNIRRIIRNRKKRGISNMSELINGYIGKDVIVWISNNSAGVVGVLKQIKDGWIEVEVKNGQTELLNVDYISRIQEHPVNKNGKKKTVIV